METCVRGFSYMPEETKMQVLDLQYIESEELERAWKTTRRQRLKEQEQKVWEEFVREQDVVKKVYHEDPYQFLHQLPEDTIKGLLDKELDKMKKKFEAKSSVVASSEQPQQGDGDSHPAESEPNTSVHEDERDEGPMFHIFDDEGSVGEEDLAQSSPSICESPANTVREREEEVLPEEVPLAQKSSENIGNVIENSIYCARVKDLRLRIFDEIANSINTLERLEVMALERESASRARRRANEFSSRYHTQKLYPLQRQLADIERINRNPAPFGKHTQFQSLMVRVVSLHQNVLLGYQGLLRNFEQTFWFEECAGCVRTLADFTRRAAAMLHPDQELLTSCNKLDEALDEYIFRVKNFFDTESGHSSTKKKQKRKMRPLKPSKGIAGKEADNRLSMYSMDTLRLNSRSSVTRDLHSAGTSKMKGSTNAQKNANMAAVKNQTKSPKVCRRPLMRAPPRRPRAPRAAPDGEVATMVEDMTCLSSHNMSRNCSPRTLDAVSPRTPKSQSVSPRQKQNISSPKHRKRHPPSTKTPKNSTKLNQTPKMAKPEIPPMALDKIINSDDANCTTDVGTDTPVQATALTAVKCQTIDISDGEKLSKFKSTMRGGKEDQIDSDGVEDSEHLRESLKEDGEKNLRPNVTARCEVTRLLKQLCHGGDQTAAKAEKVSGAKNAQLHCITGTSPRPPSTPQLLRILEETIQKKVPRSMHKKKEVRDSEKYRLMFNIPEETANNLFQYRTKFVQHMLASAMYANSAVGRPWEIVSSISEQLIDEVLSGCSNELQIKEIIDELYQCETN